VAISPFSAGLRGTQRRAGDRETTTEDAPEVDRRGVTAHESDDDQTTFDCQRSEIAGNVVAADDIEDQVDAAARSHLLDDLDEIFGAIVDRALGAELLAGATLLVRTSCRKTREPRATASWIAVVPMPLDPPWNNADSPARSFPRSKTFVQTVKNVSGMAAAVTTSMPFGIGRHWTAGAVQSVA
jgi:hypothetical protein